MLLVAGGISSRHNTTYPIGFEVSKGGASASVQCELKALCEGLSRGPRDTVFPPPLSPGNGLIPGPVAGTTNQLFPSTVTGGASSRNYCSEQTIIRVRVEPDPWPTPEKSERKHNVRGHSTLLAANDTVNQPLFLLLTIYIGDFIYVCLLLLSLLRLKVASSSQPCLAWLTSDGALDSCTFQHNNIYFFSPHNFCWCGWKSFSAASDQFELL